MKYERAFPEVISRIEHLDSYDQAAKLALEAKLSLRQWECVCAYLDVGNVQEVSKELQIARPNVYFFLNAGFAKLQEFLKSSL